MRHYFAVLLSSCILALTPGAALAPLIPGLDLSALCDHSDVIVVGRALHVRQERSTTVVIQGKGFPGRLMVVELNVEKVMKGRTEGGALTFRFAVPSVPIVSSGYEEVLAGQFGVFFLRRFEGGYQVLDPYYPSVVASPGAPRTTGSLLDQVTAEVAHVFASPEASVDTKVQAVRVLQGVEGPAAAIALRTATR